jgi:hypothetical protein
LAVCSRQLAVKEKNLLMWQQRVVFFLSLLTDACLLPTANFSFDSTAELLISVTHI